MVKDLFFSLKRPTTETSTLRIFNISFTSYNSVRSFTRNLWQVLNIRNRHKYWFYFNRSIMKLNPHFSSMQCSECFWRSLIQCTFRLFVFMFCVLLSCERRKTAKVYCMARQHIFRLRKFIRGLIILYIRSLHDSYNVPSSFKWPWLKENVPQQRRITS